MKQHRVYPLAASAFLAVSAIAAPASAQKLTFGSGAPEQASFHAKGIKPMMEAVKEATEGRVQFTGLYGGMVVALNTTLQGIRDGVVDSGYVISSFHTSELPYASMLGEMSAFSTDPLAAAGAVNEVLYKHCDSCVADFEKLGQKPVFAWATSPMTMVCTGDVKASQDLANLRVSVIGASDARWADALGMSPTRTAISDLASSLQLGRADCAIVPINWIRSYGLGDIAKSVIALPQGIGTGAIPLSISTDAWSKISSEDKASIFAVVADNLADWIQGAYLQADADVREETSKKISYVDEDPAMAANWSAYQEAELAALIELAERRGIDNAEQFVTDIAAVFRKWHEVHLPKFKDNPEAFAELLLQEAFSDAR